jgi:hypothetical protein
MNHNRVRPLSVLLLPFALLLAACGEEQGTGAAAPPSPGQTAAADSSTAASVAAAPQVAQGPASGLPANELGEIMVLEYHRIGDNEGEWVRSRANFQKDLETLYAKGYRPVTMRQVVEGNIDVPAGTTPVVFTIDDSSRGQFYYREDGSIDPNTMAGMWDAFQRQNPEWHHGAVWCVLPAADHPSNFFGAKPTREMPRAEREADIRRKMEYLVQNRHEICNHTLYHARLDRARDDAQVQEWLGVGEDSIRAYLPADYEIVTHALPLGMWPKNRSLAWSGTYRDGKRYGYNAVLEVSGGPSVSPWDTRFDPRSINRFIVAPGALERQLAAYERDPSKRYVSDGDPGTVAYPASAAGRLNRGRLSGKRAVEVAAEAPPGS